MAAPTPDRASEQFGPYVVYEQLGVGGMAAVHRAEVTGVEGFARAVALKRMLPHVAGNDEMVKAFVREARLAAHLRHANVAQTYELGRVGDTYFIAMELVVGKNLRELLKRIAQQKLGPMPVPIALNILNQICDALDYAHNLCDETGAPLGIIHRDVTPSNIIVSEGGVVKLIDFGIAKASAAGMQTMSGTLKGKFGYMAPEYIAGSLDARADLFALGVIAHELLTNRPLFSGQDDLETLTRVQQMEIPPPSTRNPAVPREIDDLVLTGLARDPERRWQHASALRSALATLTRRLGLVATNAEVHAWLAQTWARTQPGVDTRQAEDPSVVIAVGDSVSMVVSEEIVVPLQPARPLPAPPAAVPDHTPAKTMTAQRSIAPLAPGDQPATIIGHQASPEYQAAVARYERHAGISPSVGMTVADIPVLRQSNPQLALPPAQLPTTAMPPAQLPTLAVPQHSGPIALPPQAKTIFDPERQVVPVAPIAAPPPDVVHAPIPATRTSGWVLPIVMVLVVAAAAGAVVYFVLPRLTS